MLFSEPVFVFLFLPLLLLLYRLAPRPARNTLLLLASLLFYAWGEGVFVLVMLGSIVFNYLMGLLLEAGRPRGLQRPLLVLGLGGNLALLIVFKYADFLVANLNSVLVGLKLPAVAPPGVHLPIGISFFTFQAMSYVIDVARERVHVQRNPIRIALYITLFPQLIAGPIVRYQDIARQLARRVVNRAGFAEGIRRFILGLGKKTLIANVLAVPADKIFAIPTDQLTAPVAWLGVVCYALQIYFDFSGYSDMAIGLGRMFGFRFLENFRYPYIARTITEFWRRWHISLSTWYRDYLYIPLGGNRRGTLRTYLNLVIVFFLCGLWHGASWTFVLWGLFHGLFLVIERLGLGRFLAARRPVLQHAYALAVILVSWVLFRSDTLWQAIAMLAALAGFGHGSGLEYHVGLYLDAELVMALAVGVIASTPVLPAAVRALRSRRGALELAQRRGFDALAAAAEAGSLVLVFLASLSWMAAGTYNPFLYFRF
jgi:alginate O-acetyltransferase complex protein AlgI